VVRGPAKLPPPFGIAATGLLAFDRDGRIVLAEPDGSGIHSLRSSDATQYGATFSRDGTRVAFWQEDGWKVVGGNAEKAADLWVVNVDGSGAVNLTPDLDVAPIRFAPTGSWSPDGSSIAFTADTEAGMYVVATDGRSPPRAIGDASLARMYPKWAPDGSLIAFAGMELNAPGDLAFPPQPRVYVIRPDGTGQERVSRDSVGPGTGLLPQWSPDGTMLLYSVDISDPADVNGPDGQASSVRPQAPPPQELVIADRGPTRWTERVVVERSTSWLATFSNDGSRIAYLRSRPDMFEGDLFVVGIDGTGPRQVSDQLVNVSSPCWSPDDRMIAMLTGPVPAGDTLFGLPDQAYTLFPVEGGGPVEIPAGTVIGITACSWQRLAP
jgi:Tol biopolymer transport system component